MFRRLGRRFRSLLSRDYDLDLQLRYSLEQEQPFQLEQEPFFDLLEPATAALEEAKTAVLGENWREANQALYDHFHDRLRPHGLIHPTDLEPCLNALRAYPQDCRRCLRGAEMALQHRFRPLQGEEQVFPHSIDWYSNFSGGSWMMAWPSTLEERFPKHSLSADEQEGLLRSWTFNQLGHLLDLSRAHWISNNEAYASEAIVQAVDWSERNPVFVGMAWYHPKVVAVRALHWYLLTQQLLVSSLMQPEILARFLKVLLVHAGALALHLRRSQQFRLPVAASLYLISSHLPEFIPCKKWQGLARQHLSIALQDDFSQDGLHRLGNPSLHRESLDWLLICCLFDALNSRHHDQLLEVSESALEALLYLRPPSGHPGEVGANLSEGILGRDASANEHVQRLLAFGGLFFQRGDLAPAGELPAELLWWMGSSAVSRWQQLEREEPRGIRRLFAATPVAVVRDGWGPRSNWCQMNGYRWRWGQEAQSRYLHPEVIESPYHDDSLSLNLTIEGEPVLVDPGGPIAAGELGRLFGRLGTHSCVRVGREIEPLSKTPRCPEEPLKLKLESCKDGHYLCAQRPVWLDDHCEEPFWLTREVLFLPKKQRILVRDHLDGEGEVHLETNLLLAPHLDVLMRGDMGSLLRGKRLQVRILPLFPGRFRYEMLRGKPQGLQGFCWSEGGKAMPTSLLRYFARVPAPATICLWIAWNPDDTLTPRPQDLDRLFRNR